MVEHLAQYRPWIAAGLVATLIPAAAFLLGNAYDASAVERYHSPEVLLRLILISYAGGVS